MRRFLFILLSVLSLSGRAVTLSPLDYGLKDAKDGKERFEVLKRCHEDAVLRHCSVSYEGIDSIYLEIPQDAESITLSGKTDFAGVKLVVDNKEKDLVLFLMKGKLADIEVADKDFKKGKRIAELESAGNSLLVIEDQTPWVAERKGFGHAVIRKDMLLVKDGVIQNNPIQMYDTEMSFPKVQYCEVSGDRKTIKNIVFERTIDSSKRTFLLRIENQFNVIVNDIKAYTPNNGKMFGDAVMSVVNSAKIRYNNIRIEGSYSQKDTYGYGISMNNIYDVEINNMYGHAKWGVFYVSNANKIKISNSDLNRFDLHCYGRDFTITHCIFTGRPCAYSSLYGKLTYQNCTFNDADPVGLRQDYNANTPFDIIFKHCTFNMSENANCLLRINSLSDEKNTRTELSNKCLPNMMVQDCEVHFAPDVWRWFLIVTGKVAYKEPVDYLSKIKIRGLRVYGDIPFDLFSSPIETSETLDIDMDITQYVDGKKIPMRMEKATIGKRTKAKLNGKSVTAFNYWLGIKSDSWLNVSLGGAVFIACFIPFITYKRKQTEKSKNFFMESVQK